MRTGERESHGRRLTPVALIETTVQPVQNSTMMIGQNALWVKIEAEEQVMCKRHCDVHSLFHKHNCKPCVCAPISHYFSAQRPLIYTHTHTEIGPGIRSVLERI